MVASNAIVPNTSDFHQLLHKGHQPAGCRAKPRHSETCVAVSECRAGGAPVAITKPCGLSLTNAMDSIT